MGIKPKSCSFTLDILNSALDVKAFDPIILDVSKVFGLTDNFVILTGRSDRHVQGICNRILSDMEEKGIKAISVEGFEKAHWILIDFGDVIVHLFYEETRKDYDLESLWITADKIEIEELEKLCGDKSVKAA